MSQAPTPPTQIHQPSQNAQYDDVPPPQGGLLPSDGGDPTILVTPGRIVGALGQVAKAVKALPKLGRNLQQGYDFRNIEDMVAAIDPYMDAEGVVVIPSIIGHVRRQYQTGKGTTMNESIVTVSYRIMAADGSCVHATTMGESSDAADKALSQAQTQAIKKLYEAIFRLNASPDDGMNNGDRVTPPGPAPLRYPQQQPQRQQAQQPPPAQQQQQSQDVPPSGSVFNICNVRIIKSGDSGRGPWNLYGVKAQEADIEFATLSDSFFEIANGAWANGQPCRITYNAEQHGRYMRYDIQSITPQGQPAAQPQPAPGRADASAALETIASVETRAIAGNRTLFSIVCDSGQRYGAYDATIGNTALRLKGTGVLARVTYRQVQQGRECIGLSEEQTNAQGEPDIPF